MQSFSDCSPVNIQHCQHEYNCTACHWNNSYRTEVNLTGRYIRSNINIIIMKYILTGCKIMQRLWYIIIILRTASPFFKNKRREIRLELYRRNTIQ